MLKLRLVPTLISVVVASIALFGGWFLYNSLAMENPLNDIVSNTDGVREADVSLNQSKVRIDLKLENDADLQHIADTFTREGASVVDDRIVEWNIMGNGSEKLDQIWSESLFGIAQAMENRNYSDIPAILDGLKSGYPGLQSDASMGEEYVYIRLTLDGKSKFVMLPRIPSTLEVWTNE